MGQWETGCVESRETHNLPSWWDNEVILRPEGKANKEMMDIWVGKSSMRRKGERTVVLYSITYSSITKSEPDRLNRPNLYNYPVESISYFFGLWSHSTSKWKRRVNWYHQDNCTDSAGFNGSSHGMSHGMKWCTHNGILFLTGRVKISQTRSRRKPEIWSSPNDSERNNRYGGYPKK